MGNNPRVYFSGEMTTPLIPLFLGGDVLEA